MFEQAIHVRINHKPQPFKKVTQDLTRVAEHSTGGKSQMFQCCRSHEIDQRDWVWRRSWKVGQLSILSVHRQKKAAARKSHCLSYLLTATCEVTVPYWRLRQVYLDGIQREIVVRMRMPPARSLGSGWLSHKGLLPWPPLSQGDSTAGIASDCSH